jgi:hypothetical protein
MAKRVPDSLCGSHLFELFARASVRHPLRQTPPPRLPAACTRSASGRAFGAGGARRLERVARTLDARPGSAHFSGACSRAGEKRPTRRVSRLAPNAAPAGAPSVEPYWTTARGARLGVACAFGREGPRFSRSRMRGSEVRAGMLTRPATALTSSGARVVLVCGGPRCASAQVFSQVP